ncbi:MAG TPA: bifunctional hydroxymethylpyrimidine kinase/phosphomethylpyrimidine kinase [Methylocella sp.]|nr:bifunctional hydroxymethylpyrimidine kinase/phosphomethylpyrimidine kinase [Methylocella sp.]
MIPNLLTIASLDPSGGAGIIADLKTFAALRCNGMAVATALTAQNTQGVKGLNVPPADFAAAQIDAVFEDARIAAVKIGMLACGAVVEEVADRLAHYKPPFIVLDPVLVATSGDALAASDTAAAIVRHLFPLATLVTPNISEAARLSGHVIAADPEGRRRAAMLLAARGARAVLIKGGHLTGAVAEDLFFNGGAYQTFSAPRIATRNTHGTGCTLSAAIAAFLAKGLTLAEAISAAKSYLTGALKAADVLSAGKGPGPLHHFYEMWNSATEESGT